MRVEPGDIYNLIEKIIIALKLDPDDHYNEAELERLITVFLEAKGIEVDYNYNWNHEAHRPTNSYNMKLLMIQYPLSSGSR